MSDYEKAKEQCWHDFCEKNLKGKAVPTIPIGIVFDYAFHYGFSVGECNAKQSKRDPSFENPSEPKFKVGDVVQIKHDVSYLGHNGKVGEILNISNDGYYVIRCVPCCWKEEHIQHYTGSKYGDHIEQDLEMVTSDDIRLRIAAMAMQGILANKNVTGCWNLEDNQEYIAKYALIYADALIEECGKGGNDE